MASTCSLAEPAVHACTALGVEVELARLPRPRADLGRCLVTGSAGYLGRHLVAALRARGLTVHAFDCRPTPATDGVLAWVGDVADPAALREAAEGCATAFHTAAVMHLVGHAPRRVRRESERVNLGGTRAVLAACRAAGVGRLVHTSTNTVCFSPGPLVGADESRPYATRVIDVYAATKIAAEREVLAADGRGLRTVAIRPAGIWGPGPGCYMIEKLVEQLGRGRFVARIGDGRSLSDNTHVLNLIHAELAAAEALAVRPGVVGGRAYFVTDEEPMNLLEWFRPLVEALGYRVPRLALPSRLLYAAGWLSECLYRLGGPPPSLTRLEVHNLTSSFTFRTERTRSELGWRPLIGRAAGLPACLPYCRRRLDEVRRGGGGPAAPSLPLAGAGGHRRARDDDGQEATG